MNDPMIPSFGPDHERIDVSRDYELRDWAHRLQATPQQISQALHAVGDRAVDVAMHLRVIRSPACGECQARA